MANEHAIDEDDRRSAARQRTIKTGTIVYDNNQCTMDCVILDVSEQGGRIQPADVLACPDSFILKIKAGATHHCQVVNQDGNKFGVRFVEAPNTGT